MPILGGHSWDLAIIQTAATPFGSGTLAADDGFDLFFGGGNKNTKLLSNFSAVLEIERDDFGGQINKSLNLFSAGIQITF